ncbi:capsular polysaccharide transport system permease protein [Shimia sagamensis]|uniref:Capsular polysaccharide transport system permease protein n=2 Tax=Shimia sagamensis TaxID=1566352 RepID=A0ABY1NBW9_9RHOB|nr:capsular polysaccharide transport system permease protein [Shimia sagamensis]
MADASQGQGAPKAEKKSVSKGDINTQKQPTPKAASKPAAAGSASGNPEKLKVVTGKGAGKNGSAAGQNAQKPNAGHAGGGKARNANADAANKKPHAKNTTPNKTPQAQSAETPQLPVPAPAPAPVPKTPDQPRKVQSKPPAKAARMSPRHWVIVASFFLMVILPIGGVVGYLWGVSKDQFGSVTGFTVRQEESAGAQEILGGLAQLTGGNTSGDGEILYQFILSQRMVRLVEESVGLRAHYSQYWKEDPVFSLWPDATIEDLEWFWTRIVRVSLDSSSGLIDVQVRAFDPETANAISSSIVSYSQAMINALNDQAREDAMRYAREDLETSVDRLKIAREALTAFRTRTRIVDPASDLQGRMGVMSNLQQQLAEALIEYDLLKGTTSPNDPRISQTQRRITAIQDRIKLEREAFATESIETGAGQEDYPDLIAEYEGLVVDREFAEGTYRATLSAVDVARAKAQRQSRYLATFVPPTLAESSEYPKRITMAALAALCLLLVWSILTLVYYSIRDRS